MDSSTKYIYLKAFILTLILSCNYFYVFAKSDIDSLKSEFLKSTHDSTRIQLLFQMGNRFLEGPSDSLIYYYQQALNTIESFFLQPREKLLQNDEKTIAVYQRFYFRALNEIGIEKFFLGQYNESLEYAFRALKIAEEIKDIGLISECCGAIGIVYKNQGKYSEALDYYQRALDLAIELQDTAWIAACYANAGNVYRRLGNFSKALNYLLQAYEVFEQSGEKRRMAIGLMNIGNLYEDQKDDSQALEYYNKALQISYETNDYKRIAECLLNIGNIHLERQNFAKARENYEQSLKIHQEQGFMHTLDDCYKNIGNAFEIEGNFAEAINYYHKALELGGKEDDKGTISEVQGRIAGIFILQNEFKKALESADKSLSIAEQTGDIQNMKNAYELLSKAYEGLNNTGAALDNYKKFTNLKDSLFSADKYRAIKEIEAKYELEKKEQQLELLTEKNQVQMLTLSQRNRMILTSLGLIILIVAIGYILIHNNRLKARNQAIELEQKLLRSQMNPHFIFNSLMAIQSFIYKNDPVQAGDFLAKFADLVRITLENSRVEFVLLENEIKMLQIYLELQALRFNNKFGYSIHVDENIDIRLIKVPPMLAQPLIENAIEHGLRHKTEDGFIKINYAKLNNDLRFSVEDNGIGREKARELENNRKHRAMATSITRERLILLSKRLRQTFELELIDLKDQNNLPHGTLVKFALPYQVVE
jgi:tetratricopeptide (TPR) repeat protein